MKKRIAPQRKKKGDSVSHKAKAKLGRLAAGNKANKNGKKIAKKLPKKITIKGKKQPAQRNTIGREKNPLGSSAASAGKLMLCPPSHDGAIKQRSKPAFQKRCSSPVIRAHPLLSASPVGGALKDLNEDEVKKRRRHDSSDSECMDDVKGKKENEKAGEKLMGDPRGKQSLEPETRQTHKNLGSKSKSMNKIGEEDYDTKEEEDEKEKAHEGKSREKDDAEDDEQEEKQKNWSAVNLAWQESRLQFRGILTEKNFTNWLWVKVIHDKLAETKRELPEVAEDELTEELNELFAEFLPKKKEESNDKKDKKEKKDKKSSKKKAKKDAVKWTRKEKLQVANLIKNMIYGSDGDKGQVSGWINFVSEKEVPVTCPWEFQLAHCLYRCLNMEYEFEKKKNAPDQRLFYAEMRSLADAIGQIDVKYRLCFSEEDVPSSAPVNIAVAIQKRLNAGSAGIKFDPDWYLANKSRLLSGSFASKKNTHTTTPTSTTSIKTREQGPEIIMVNDAPRVNSRGCLKNKMADRLVAKSPKLHTLGQNAQQESTPKAENRPEHSKPLSETLLTDHMSVELSYDGPVYKRGDKIDAQWVRKLLDYQRRGKKVHIKYAYNMVLDVLEILKEYRTVQLITVPESGKFTVCDNIHGQYDDLLKIWNTNGNPSETNPYLFNGDFVDRGSFSIEVMFGLFAWKLCYPQHLFMSRGYHETAKLNRLYVFEGEPTIKYNVDMYRLFCEAFCYMPLAHILNDKVFVVHGGLFSKDDGKLSELVATDRVREPPQEGFITEHFWSDPQPEHGRAPSERSIGVAYGH